MPRPSLPRTASRSAPLRTDPLDGWLQAIGNVVAAGALSLAYAIGQSADAHPIAFVLYAMVASATGMLSLTGFGTDARAIARHALSWVVGVSIILIETCYFLTLAYVSPAHGNLVVRIGIPIAMLAGWAFFRRRSPPLAVVAGAVITLAVAYVIAATAPAVRWPMAAAAAATGFFMVVRSFAAEFHPFNRAARTVMEKLRVTGVVVLVTSVLGLGLVAALAAATGIGAVPRLGFLPTLSDIANVPTMLLGGLMGGTILTLMAYFNFSSVVKIGAANHTAMMAFSPVTSWAFQELGVLVGLIAVTRPEPRLVAAMAVIVAAVLLIFWAGRRPRVT